MRFYRETALIKKADKATLRLIHMWHELSKSQFGHSIEIVIADRKEHGQLKEFKGELNTAWPIMVKNRPVLCLWLDDLNNVKPFILTHELGHWVIKLLGFKSAADKSVFNSDEEIYLNSMCHHPAVFNLQRRVGHEPQFEIDVRARHDFNLVRKDHPKHSDNDLKIILLLADDIFNASNNISRDILKRAKRFHSNIYEKIQLVNNILNKYDLLNPEENLKCKFNIIEELNMGPNWVVSKDIEKLREMVASTRWDDLNS